MADEAQNAATRAEYERLKPIDRVIAEGFRARHASAWDQPPVELTPEQFTAHVKTEVDHLVLKRANPLLAATSLVERVSRRRPLR